MRKELLTGLAALAMGSTALLAEGSLTPAAAQFINPDLAQVAPAPEVTTVQYRGRHYGGPGYRGRYYGGPGYRGRPYYGPRGGYYYGRPYYRGRSYNPGAAAAAGVAGLAAGAIIGGAIASQNAAPARGDSWLAYCSAKYRSFDPASGTYLGYDGRRHVCQ
jgi:hypothetical protein